ncbi:MAG: class I SAM-dependent methyltransferase [Actinomycetota bacterium]|jgi:SAM-dependent methyltransferase
MAVRRGDRVEYVGEPFWLGPDDEDWIRPGHSGTVIDLEPPDDSPIISFDEGGALVLEQSDVRRIKVKTSDSDRQVIEEQIEYYDRRAPEYDATSISPGDPLAPFMTDVETALHRFAPRGTVLEIGCGTGKRTEWLLEHAHSVTALDASAAMLERARRNVGDVRVHWVLADAFRWEPVHRYDVVFFAFWLSHVPVARFDQFWRLVARCLHPEGRVFFLDEGRHDHWHEENIDPAVPLVRRRLKDGSEHHVVKVFWAAKELEDKLTGMGWKVTVQTAGHLYWGKGMLATSE